MNVKTNLDGIFLKLGKYFTHSEMLSNVFENNILKVIY